MSFDPSVFFKMLTLWDVLLMALVWIGLHLVQERFPEPFERPRIGWRLLPFSPSLLCMALSLMPGPWYPPDVDPTVAERLLLGALLGWCAYNFGGVAIRLHLTDALNAIGVTWLVDKTKAKDAPEDPDTTPVSKELPK